MHLDISQIFAVLKEDPRWNGFGLSKPSTTSKTRMRQYIQSPGNKLLPKQRYIFRQITNQDHSVFGYVWMHSFSWEDQDPVVHQVWVATFQGQGTIAKKRLAKTVITKSSPYLIYLAFNLRQTEWLGKHGPDFHLFLSQWSSYPLPHCPQTAKDTQLPHRSVLFSATSKSLR